MRDGSLGMHLGVLLALHPREVHVVKEKMIHLTCVFILVFLLLVAVRIDGDLMICKL